MHSIRPLGYFYACLSLKPNQAETVILRNSSVEKGNIFKSLTNLCVIPNIVVINA